MRIPVSKVGGRRRGPSQSSVEEGHSWRGYLRVVIKYTKYRTNGPGQRAQVDAASRSCESSHFAVPISTRRNILQYITPTWGPPTFCMDGTDRGRSPGSLSKKKKLFRKKLFVTP